MKKALPIDIDEHHLKIVNSILQQYLDETDKVWVFGSRARRKARRASDLDLAIDTGRKISLSTLMKLEESFEASDLPYTVDIVDMHNVSDNFHKIIDEQKVILAR
ncbi:MAG: nucleotidyltransferase domain-containing protein [Gammaproteobacteria bacterium]|nr:nucleotidyltransferase domain-containing protein [Gammaproteobacteria bacterium]